MYHHIVQAVAKVHAGDLDGAVVPLQAVNMQLKKIFRYFYTEFNSVNLTYKLLVPFVQGFHGWTLDGENGASGDQSLTIRTLDAFLGIRPLQTPEVEALLLPGLQRDWINSLRDFDIRARARESPEVLAELEHMLKQMRVSSLSLSTHSGTDAWWIDMAYGAHAKDATIRDRGHARAQGHERGVVSAWRRTRIG